MSDLKHTLQMARDEINLLRRINEVLQAKVDVMELFGLVFRTTPNYPRVVSGQDPAWLLQCELDKLDASPRAKETSQ